jgi:Zn-dependent peptidase ImmA (M78 family)
LIRALGINQPRDIDLEAIAAALGAKVRSGKLENCEARLIGFRDRAIITVNSGGDWRRRRFSIAHELGHWHCHRGRISVCGANGGEAYGASQSRIEREADDYASKLLMPASLFARSVGERSYRTFGVVDALAREYKTSRVATLLRIIDLDLWPCMLIYYPLGGRRWHRKSRSFPIHAMPRMFPPSDSSAAELMSASVSSRCRARKTDVATWFETICAPKTCFFWEASRRSFCGSVLTLLVSG